MHALEHKLDYRGGSPAIIYAKGVEVSNFIGEVRGGCYGIEVIEVDRVEIGEIARRRHILCRLFGRGMSDGREFEYRYGSRCRGPPCPARGLQQGRAEVRSGSRRELREESAVASHVN